MVFIPPSPSGQAALKEALVLALKRRSVASRARSSIDRQLGISTSRKVRIASIARNGPLVRVARDYEPTPPDVFEDMMSAVRLPDNELTFVDWGAGKGRVLCLAAGRPFRQVVGCELFEPLQRQAERNLGALRKDFVRAASRRCVLEDAGAFVPPPGPKVVFLFNPFGPPVLKRCLQRLEAERDEQGGPPLYILYYEPVHAAHVDAHGWLERRVDSAHWTVWASPEAL